MRSENNNGTSWKTISSELVSGGSEFRKERNMVEAFQGTQTVTSLPLWAEILTGVTLVTLATVLIARAVYSLFCVMTNAPTLTLLVVCHLSFGKNAPTGSRALVKGRWQCLGSLARVLTSPTNIWAAFKRRRKRAAGRWMQCFVKGRRR